MNYVQNNVTCTHVYAKYYYETTCIFELASMTTSKIATLLNNFSGGNTGFRHNEISHDY